MLDLSECSGWKAIENEPMESNLKLQGGTPNNHTVDVVKKVKTCVGKHSSRHTNNTTRLFCGSAK